MHCRSHAEHCVSEELNGRGVRFRRVREGERPFVGLSLSLDNRIYGVIGLLFGSWRGCRVELFRVLWPFARFRFVIW